MSKRTPIIRYTSRDFDSIKTDLVNYAKKYYPDVHQDFNEGSFGSLVTDMVAYVGDVLSYYLDYQANESFLATAIEYGNILKLGKALGYRPKLATAASGIVTIYVPIPANSFGTSYDSNYLPVIKKGTSFSSNNGNNYTLIDDVVMTTSNTEIRKSKINENSPFQFVAKTYGKVISGLEEETTISIGDFEKFKKVKVGFNNISEILSVVDTNGNEYYEVDYLTQNVIYRSTLNPDASQRSQTPSLLKPYGVARRFIVVREDDGVYIQFGGASDSSTIFNNNKKLDPSNVVINSYGKDYITDESFDPSILVSNDKLGIAPSNTIITIKYRADETIMMATPSNSITRVANPVLEFQDQQNLDIGMLAIVRNGIRVTNEFPIVGFQDEFTSEEIKNKIYGTFSAQNRAVTTSDYEALCYNMPGKYGAIRRVRAMQGYHAGQKKINLYVLSEDDDGNLVSANNSTKNNLKNWLNKSKMINDNIEILDPYVVNFGIYFTAMIDRNYNKYDVLANGIQAVINEFSIKMDIGEHLHIARVYNALRKVDGLIDVRSVMITNKLDSSTVSYSNYSFNFDENMTKDGTFIRVPKNVVMELKYPTSDVEGRII
jgi:hypothetical protein